MSDELTAREELRAYLSGLEAGGVPETVIRSIWTFVERIVVEDQIVSVERLTRRMQQQVKTKQGRRR